MEETYVVKVNWDRVPEFILSACISEILSMKKNKVDRRVSQMIGLLLMHWMYSEEAQDWITVESAWHYLRNMHDPNNDKFRELIEIAIEQMKLDVLLQGEVESISQIFGG